MLAQLERERSDRIRAEREAKPAEDIGHLKWTEESSVEFAEVLKSDFDVTIRPAAYPKAKYEPSDSPEE